MRLLLAANNQATRRNEIIKSYLQLGSSSNRYAPPLAPTRNQIIYKNSFLRRTPILGPENLLKNRLRSKRAPLVALPAAISHKASLKTKRCASATLIQQTSKNEPKHGPKNGTAWRSHFWDRVHRLVKKQKKSSFTVSFLGPSGSTKMRPQNRKINSKGRPVQRTKK